MREKIFKPIKIGSATALISITSLLSYAIGLYRDRILAVNFDASAATDTYAASFLIPDILFNLFIAGALSAAFLPVFTSYLIKDQKEAQKIASTMLTSATLVITSLAILAFIFMHGLIPFLFPNADPSMQQDIINMTRIMLASAILFAISNTLGNILMSYKHFVAYSISPIFYNLGIILGIIFLSDQYGIYSAAIGVVVGALLHCLIRVIDTRMTSFKFTPQLDLKHPGFKKILKLMLPKSISLIAWQINLYIYAVIGIKLIEGGLAAFHFARNIQSFAVSLFGIAFATAVFPHLTESAASRDHKKYTEHIQKTSQRILFFTLPATIGLMLLSDPIISIVLGGGEFQEKSIHLTGLILFFFAISIPFESLVHILARGFYALHNTLTPMIINISIMTLIGLITVFIAPTYGIEWFSIGFSLALTLQVILLTFLLRKHLKEFNYRNFFISLLKTFISTASMAIIVISLSPIQDLIDYKIANLLRILAGGIVYFFVAAIVKSPEISSVNYILKRIFKKNTYANN